MEGNCFSLVLNHAFLSMHYGPKRDRFLEPRII